MESTKNILIVAGEASGDLHAACLVKAIRGLYPQKINFFGLGGARLKESGVHLYFNIVELAVVGFLEVLRNLGKFRRIFVGLLREVDRIKPDLAILVDYPGFNLRLAGELKKKGIPVIYYISPQVWAWGEKRIKTIRKLIDLMLVVFKFEEALYKKNDIPVVFIGHPLLDIVEPKISREEVLNKWGDNLDNPTLALLPGSREKEVNTLLPIMLDTAGLIYKYRDQNIQFLILRSGTVKEEVFYDILKRYELPVKIISDMTYEGLAASDFAIVASGTATLETAILRVPMVIIYKVSFLTWLYIKSVIKIPYIGLVNVVKQEKFIPEFIQYNAKPKRIADYIVKILNDRQKISQIKQGLSDVASLLGEKGASQKGAQEIINLLNAKERQIENKPY